VWGTAGAIAVRVAMTLIVVALLKIPGLMLIGGGLLVWIAYKLLASDQQGDEADHAGAAAKAEITGLGSALRTIVVADAVMGLDNVLGVAGAADGSFLLVILGLLISIPIMVWGSTLVLKFVDRHPAVVYVGAGVLAWTATRMIEHEPWVKAWFASHPWAARLVDVAIISGVLLAGYLRNRKATAARAAGSVQPAVTAEQPQSEGRSRREGREAEQEIR
jgi:YjbE family integral membrane protein